jgi:hypothetical protein
MTVRIRVSSYFFRFKRLDINVHIAADDTAPAAFTLRADLLLPVLTQDVAIAATTPANGHFRFFLHMMYHNSAIYYILQKLGSTRRQMPSSPRSWK